MLGIGANGDGHTHRIFAIPIFIWAVWSLRHELVALPIRSCWIGLIAIGAAGFLWLAGDLTFTRIFAEIGVVAMVPLVVLTTLGYRWLFAISYPLLLLLFVVPVRGPLVNLQVELTARFTYIGLLATGIPVHREGPYFELPSGKWSIASACSGIEYLSACTMLTVLYAWTMFYSAKKRVLFVIGGVIVGVTGNWLRAYLTILIAHFSDNRYLRDGHGTFGWMLFATILFFYCMMGWYFRDQERSGIGPKHVHAKRRDSAPSTQFAGVGVAKATFAALLALGVWPLISLSFSDTRRTRTVEIARIAPTAGWSTTPTAPSDWTPSLTNPTVQGVQTFEKHGRKVGVFIGIFSPQTWSSKLVSSVNDFVDSESVRWVLVKRGTSTVPYLDAPLVARTGLILDGGNRILAWQWYWTNGESTSNDIGAKLIQLRERLEKNDSSAAWITVYTMAGESQEMATQAMAEFVRDMGRSLEQALVQTRNRGAS